MTHRKTSYLRLLELRTDAAQFPSSMAAFLASTLATILVSIILIGAIAFLRAGLD